MAKQIDYGSVLNDFIQTVNDNPNATDEQLLGAFGEFNNDHKLLDAAFSYKATREANKYDEATLNSKFPEFFSAPAAEATQEKKYDVASAPVKPNVLPEGVSQEDVQQFMDRYQNEPRDMVRPMNMIDFNSEETQAEIDKAKRYKTYLPEFEKKWQVGGIIFRNAVESAKEEAKREFANQMSARIGASAFAPAWNAIRIASQAGNAKQDPADIMDLAFSRIIGEQPGAEPTDEQVKQKLNVDQEKYDAYKQFVMDKMQSYFVDEYMPKSRLEYFAKKFLMSNNIGQFAGIATMPVSMRQFDVQGMSQYSEENGTTYTDIAAGAAGFVADPTIVISMGAGKLVGDAIVKGATKAGGKVIARKFVTQNAQAVAERYLAQSAALRRASSMITSGTSISAMDIVGSVIGQAYQTGDVDFGEVASSAAKGFGTGLLFGAAHLGGEAVQRAVARKYGQNIGLAAGKTTQFAGGASVLMGSSVGEKLANGTSLDEIKWGEEFTHASLMQMLFDLYGMAKVGSVRDLRRRIDAMKDNPNDMSFTQRDVEEFNRAGFEGNNTIELLNNFGVREGASAEDVRESVKRIAENPNITTSTKYKFINMLTGETNVGPAPIVVGEPVKSNDGEYEVQMFDDAGMMYSRKSFSTESAAREYAERMSDKVKKNIVARCEAILSAKGVAKETLDVTEDVIDTYLNNYPGDSREEAYHVLTANKSELSKIQLAKRNAIERYLEERVTGVDAVSDFRARFAENHGLSTDRLNDIIDNETGRKRDYVELSKNDKTVYDAYLDELSQTFGTRNSHSDANSGRSAAETLALEIDSEVNVNDGKIYAVSLTGEDGEWRIRSGAHVEDGVIVLDSEDAIVVIENDNGPREVNARLLTLLADPVDAEEAKAALIESVAAEQKTVTFNAFVNGEERQVEGIEQADGSVALIGEDGQPMADTFTYDELANVGFVVADPTAVSSSPEVEQPEAEQPVEQTEPIDPIVADTDAFISKHGDKAPIKLEATLKAINEDLAKAQKVLSAAQKKYDALPEAYTPEMEAKEQKALQDVQNAQAEVDKYQAIADKYNGIKGEIEKRNAPAPAPSPAPAAEIVTTEEPAAEVAQDTKLAEKAQAKQNAIDAAKKYGIDADPDFPMDVADGIVKLRKNGASADDVNAYAKYWMDNMLEDDVPGMAELRAGDMNKAIDLFLADMGMEIAKTPEMTAEQAKAELAQRQSVAPSLENGLEQMENSIADWNSFAASEESKQHTQENIEKAIQLKNQILEADNIIRLFGWGNANADELHTESTRAINEIDAYVNDKPSAETAVTKDKFRSDWRAWVDKQGFQEGIAKALKSARVNEYHGELELRLPMFGKSGDGWAIVGGPTKTIPLKAMDFYDDAWGKNGLQSVDNFVLNMIGLDKWKKEQQTREPEDGLSPVDAARASVEIAESADAIRAAEEDAAQTFAEMQDASAREAEKNDLIPNNADELLKKIYDAQYEAILSIQDYTKKKDFEVNGTIDTYKRRVTTAKREYTHARNHGTWDDMKEAVANLARKQAFYKSALNEKESRDSKNQKQKEQRPIVDGVLTQLFNVPSAVKTKLGFAKVYTDKGYKYTRVQIAAVDGNMYIRMSGTYKGNPVKEYYLELKEWENVSFPELMNMLNEHDLNTRHLYDAITWFYKDNGKMLSVQPVLRPFKRTATSEEQKPIEHKPIGADNKVFTQDAYEAARKRMKARLNHLNAGLDPEALLDGMVVAGYHVEAGARKFVDYAKAMLADFGDAIRPYLKAFYNGMRDLPEAAELAKEMDDYDTVASIDVEKITLNDKVEQPVEQNPAERGSIKDALKEATKKSEPKYKVGDIVYYGSKEGMLQAKVVDVNSNGTYNVSNKNNATMMSVNMMDISEKDLYDIKDTDRMGEFFKLQFADYIKKQKFSKDQLEQLRGMVDAEIEKLTKKVKNNNGGTDVDMVEAVRLNGMIAAILDAVDGRYFYQRGDKQLADIYGDVNLRKVVNRLGTLGVRVPSDTEKVGDTAFSRGDSQGVEQYSNGLTEAQQAATDAVKTMLEDAGIKVNLVSNEEADATADEAGVSYSVVTDNALKAKLGKEFDGEFVDIKDVLKKLENGEKLPVGYTKMYRAVSVIDGKVYSPKMTILKGVGNEIKLGEIEQSDEKPEIAFPVQLKNGEIVWKVNLNGGDQTGSGLKARSTDGVDYNPYIHLSSSPMNDQFVAAYAMPEMAVIEVKVPLSEFTSGYKAEKAAASVGVRPWHKGTVQTKLSPEHQRVVMLSRYDMPIRVVDVNEVADNIAKQLIDSNVAMPFNLVTPQLAEALVKRGANVSDKPSGNVSAEQVADWARRRANFSTDGRKVFGFTKDGEITLSERGINPNTPVHEYSHLWCAAVRKNNAELWSSVRDLFNGYADEVRSDEAYKGLSDDDIIEEAVARFSGKQGAKRLEDEAKRLLNENPSINGQSRIRAIIGKVKSALEKLWNWIGKNLFQLKSFNSAEEVADRIMYDLANKTNLQTGNVGEATPGHTEEHSGSRFQIDDRTWREDLNDLTSGKPTIVEDMMGRIIDAAVKENADSYNMTDRAVRNIDARLKDLRKAMQQQKISDRDAVRTLATMAKIFVKNGWMDKASKTEIYNAIDAIRDAVGKKDLTAEINELTMAVTSAHLRHIESVFNNMRSTRATKKGISGNVVQNKLDIDAQHRMRAFNECVDLNYTGDEIDELIGKAMDKYKSTTDDSVRRQYEQEINGFLMAKEYIDHIQSLRKQESDLVKELRETKDADMSGAEHPILAKRQLLREIEDAIIRTRMELADAYNSLNASLYTSVLVGKMGASAHNNKIFQNMLDIRHKANSDMELIGDKEDKDGNPIQKGSDVHYTETASQKAVNSILFAGGVFQPVQDLNSILKRLAPHAPNGQGYLWDHFVRGCVNAEDKEFNGLKEMFKELDDKCSEIFGSETTLRRFAMKMNSLSGETVEIWDNGGFRDHELTQGQLAYLYAMEKQADGRMKLRKMGITEKRMVEIANKVLDPRVKQFMDWAQGEFLVRTRNKYNKVHEDLFGAPMAAHENYFPILIRQEARGQQERIEDNTDGIGNLSGTTTGAIIDRVCNTLPIDILNADAFSVLVDHIMKMEHWAAFAELNRDANVLLSYNGFKNKLGHMTTIYGGGEQLRKNVKDAFRLAIGSYIPKGSDADKIYTSIAHGVSTSKVALRPWTAIKQLLSLPAYSTEISEGDGTFLPRMMFYMARPISTYDWAIENVPTFSKRVEGRAAGDTRIQNMEDDWRMWHKHFVELCVRTGMAPNAFVDAYACSVGARAYYDVKYKEYVKRGLSKDAAHQIAREDAAILFNESQQSSVGAFISRTQKDQTTMAIARTLFQNANISYMKREFQHIQELKNNATEPAKQIEYLAKKYVRMGMDEETANKSAKVDYARLAARNAIGIAVFGLFMNMVWRLGNYGYYLMFGHDDDEKQKMIDDALYSSSSYISPIRGTLIGSGLESCLDGRAGIEKIFNPSLPIEDNIKNISNELKYANYDEVVTDVANMCIAAGLGFDPQTIMDAICAISDACDGDVKTTHEAALLVGRLLMVPESQTKKLYIDEIGTTADEIVDAIQYDNEKLQKLIKRYVDYKIDRSAYDFLQKNDGSVEQVKDTVKQTKSFVGNIKERLLMHEQNGNND